MQKMIFMRLMLCSCVGPSRRLACSSQPRDERMYSSSSEATQRKHALSGIKVLDLTRVLAGPFATQLLGDLGADVIKVESLERGDDTREWGPPYWDEDGSSLPPHSAYFLSANRNKKSICVDIATEKGQDIIRRLVKNCDVLVENFKVGGLSKYKLSYSDLKGECPSLIYCSITGFGQKGPRAKQAGYDFLMQGMGGLMSITGHEETGPVKVGVAVTDLFTGMYANTAILAALYHREKTGEGQHLDVSLFDSQLAMLANQGMNALVSGRSRKLLGNTHPSIVPYQSFRASNGSFIIAVGNDDQFRRLCRAIGKEDLLDDERFATNASRVKFRSVLTETLQVQLLTNSKEHWEAVLQNCGVPVGPINSVEEAFNDEQAQFRNMVVQTEDSPHGGGYPLIGNPIKMSECSLTYRKSPPSLGEDTSIVLKEELGLSEKEIAELKESNTVR